MCIKQNHIMLTLGLVALHDQKGRVTLHFATDDAISIT